MPIQQTFSQYLTHSHVPTSHPYSLTLQTVPLSSSHILQVCMGLLLQSSLSRVQKKGRLPWVTSLRWQNISTIPRILTKNPITKALWTSLLGSIRMWWICRLIKRRLMGIKCRSFLWTTHPNVCQSQIKKIHNWQKRLVRDGLTLRRQSSGISAGLSATLRMGISGSLRRSTWKIDDWVLWRIRRYRWQTICSAT